MKLKTCVQIDSLQPQLASYLGSQARARSYIPAEGGSLLLLDVSPSIAAERLVDAVFKSSEKIDLARQGGLLELYAENPVDLDDFEKLLLKKIDAKPADLQSPEPGYIDLIEDVSDRHAIMLNAARRGSMIIPGDSLLIYEVSPAPFAVLLANVAEKAAPEITIVDLQEFGNTGRLYLSGSTDSLSRARDKMTECLQVFA